VVRAVLPVPLGLVVGMAVGAAAASHPGHVALVYAPPPVVYAPGGYYYVP